MCWDLCQRNEFSFLNSLKNSKLYFYISDLYNEFAEILTLTDGFSKPIWSSHLPLVKLTQYSPNNLEAQETTVFFILGRHRLSDFWQQESHMQIYDVILQVAQVKKSE